MKVVVMERNGCNLVVVDDKGCFHIVKNQSNYNIGDEIQISNINKPAIINLKKLTAIAAMLIIMLGSSYGALTYYSPYTYVNIDINPSIELVLNRYDRVLEVETLNDDAKKIVTNGSDYKNKNLTEAVNQLLDTVKEKKIFTEQDDNTVMYTVSGRDQKNLNKINEKLKTVTEKKLNKLIKQENILLKSVTLDEHEAAKKLEVSPGKVILLKELKKVKPNAKLQDIKKLPVKETLKLIRERQQIKKELKESLQNQRKELKKDIKNNIKDNAEENKKKDVGNSISDRPNKAIDKKFKEKINNKSEINKTDQSNNRLRIINQKIKDSAINKEKNTNSNNVAAETKEDNNSTKLKEYKNEVQNISEANKNNNKEHEKELINKFKKAKLNRSIEYKNVGRNK